MENEKKFLLRLPASVVENLKKVNKYNLSLNKQINIKRIKKRKSIKRDYIRYDARRRGKMREKYWGEIFPE